MGFSWVYAAALLLAGGYLTLVHAHPAPKSTTPGTPAAPGIDKDIAAYVQTMTVEQKVGQMTQLTVGVVMKDGSATEVDPDKMGLAAARGVGSILNVPSQSDRGGLNAAQWRTLVDDIQQYYLNPQIFPLQIPTLYGLDSVHGANYVWDSVVFPHNLGLASSFNPKLAEVANSISASNTRNASVPWCFSPVLDVAVNPLWPRLYESFGEDPFLVSEFGRASVTGMQGSSLLSSNTCAACAKHFIGYSAPRTGKDRTDSWLPENYLLQYFLPPFQAAVDAGVATVMVNSASINGVPVHASYEHLTGVLRDRLGFKGVVVTDWEDIAKLYTYHRLAADYSEAIVMAITAGVDMAMVPNDYEFTDILIDLVHRNVVPIARIDTAVQRILQLKKNIGLWSPPHPDAPVPATPSLSEQKAAIEQTAAKLKRSQGSNIERVKQEPKDRAVSLSAARESIVLLKNGNPEVANSTILPLDGNTSILLVGPAAHNLPALCGGWTYHWQGAFDNEEFEAGTTIFTGLQMVLQQLGKRGSVRLANVTSFDVITDQEIADAVALVSKVSVIVLAVGEAPESESLGNIDDLTLSSPQIKLYQALAAAAGNNKPIVTVVVAARPRILGPIANSSAVLMAFLPAQEGGQAVAEILFGKINPSAKLSVTYPANSGDLDVYYHKPWGSYSQGTDVSSFHRPLYTFGHGLSYTTFTYSDLNVRTSLSSASSSIVTVAVDPSLLQQYQQQQQQQKKNINPYFAKHIVPLDSVLAKSYPIHYGGRLETSASASVGVKDEQFACAVDVTVTNSGARDGQEAVLVYLQQHHRHLVTPEDKMLKAFTKVNVPAGKTTKVSLSLSPTSFAYIDPSTGKWVMESGNYTIQVGALNTTITVQFQQLEH